MKRICGLLICLGVLSLLLPIGFATASRSMQITEGHSSYRPCGKLDRRTWVGVKKVHCPKAKRILRYWTAYGPGVIWHSGGDYYTLRRYPGWRCASGALSGVCSKGRRKAEYNTYGPYRQRVAAKRDRGSAKRRCGAIGIDFTPTPGEHYRRMYLRATSSLRCGRARKVMRRYQNDESPCSGSSCVRSYPDGWRCNASTPGRWPVIQICVHRNRFVFGFVKSKIKGPRNAPAAWNLTGPDSRLRSRRLPRMLNPTPNYGSSDGGYVWHTLFKPRHWTDGDTVAVSHARWLRWNARFAVARVRVNIAGQRGRGRVVLGNPGYCGAAHTYGYRSETVSGGPWGRSGTANFTDICSSTGGDSVGVTPG